ncbi:MAG: FAD-binding protein [Candidatus Omnitrophica bacterium]|nr:FAD-binding protein [Candidatus Omnitrophota bacterium]
MAFEELQKAIQGKILTDPKSLEEASSDFGRMIVKIPTCVVQPKTTEDVATVVRWVRETKTALGIRGNAHTQTGQGLSEGGILLDLKSLDRVLAIDPAAKQATCQAGVKWRDLVNQTVAQGLIPRVLTNNLDVTLGGTLSVAGLGISSFQYGTQGDNCLELEVVTGKGEIVTCSPQKNSELFFCSLAGLGRFAIITRATIQLRDALPKTRTYYLLYEGLKTFMADAQSLMTEGRFHFLESWCVPCPQGFRKVNGIPQLFARWFYPLHATVEFDEKNPPDDEKLLKGLSFHELVHREDRSTLEFANRLEPLFELWKRSGYWAHAHPWMETILPWDTAFPYINQVLSNLPPQALGGGHILLWPSRGSVSHLPLFKHPATECVMGFGILPGLPKEFLPQSIAMLNVLSDLSIKAGGKRYLSGLIQFDEARWKHHYGETWEAMKGWKAKYDPDRILNPGFLPL